MKRIDCGPRFCRQRLAPPDQFDTRSFRTVTVKGRRDVRIVVGCPKGEYAPRAKRCHVGLRAQSIVRTRTNSKCRAACFGGIAELPR